MADDVSVVWPWVLFGAIDVLDVCGAVVDEVDNANDFTVLHVGATIDVSTDISHQHTIKTKVIGPRTLEVATIL